MSDIPDALRFALSDRYQLRRELGRGGMATVYLARDLKHNRQVAVKVLRPDLTASLGADRFLREIQISAQLQHPHILMLIDSGEGEGLLYYVMPYVAGISLRDLLNSETHLEPPAAVAITKEVADALGYAHRKGVLHRDIKPENILLSEGHAVVADFGIAKAISTAAGENLTRTGFPLGTPGYMSPEQAAGVTELDARTDVYSLACVCYEMLVGDTPGMWPTDEAVKLGRFIHASPEHRERLDLLRGSVEQALVKALAIRPELRFGTPNEFVRVLEQSPEGKRKYRESEMRQIVKRAAEMQVERPTEDAVLSLGGIQQIAAEVGISPERVKEAVLDLQKPSVEPARGGIFGVSGKIELERRIDIEISQQEYATLVEEIQATTDEVGWVNHTPGRSLSWNSPSFQRPFTGLGRSTHVMVIPRRGYTRIRITEGEGTDALGLGILVIAAGIPMSVVGAALAGAAGAGALGAVLAVGVVLGGVYLAARTWFQRHIRDRFRLLSKLLDRLSSLVADTARKRRLDG